VCFFSILTTGFNCPLQIFPQTLVLFAVCTLLASVPSIYFLWPPKHPSQACFEELCQNLFHGTLDPFEKVLRDSKIDKSNVHEIVFVGGSTRIPCIVKLVSDFFSSKEPNKSINPDEADAAVQDAGPLPGPDIDFCHKITCGKSRLRASGSGPAILTAAILNLKRLKTFSCSMLSLFFLVSRQLEVS
jgi:hypothetical protein